MYETKSPEKFLHDLSIPIFEIKFTVKNVQPLNVNVVKAQL
jgi:hypothetical protein